ncbi:ABC transporter ATP-binding protein [Cytophagaceae bacterium YF14B1]|uniref:ABC transporter ATP-binding protein n=1 Tax=Xanthocytophaga flava TaxID=3048013 RepID=A0AAE3QRM4_9BACT|nr:ABC transporter ATP-binding protein [Xanthocytophaga flavus]MDJ1482173.1 ABC transporter ATP-binding protein [Xanthocytophaga flavus]
MSVVVKVENISKRYQLGKAGSRSLKGDFQRWWAQKRGKEDPFLSVAEASQVQDGEFLALKDVNFEIKQGDAVGIVGKNGAGKSTLLKILSRITLPTTGSIKIKGRIASLLEVGTGFNPDLSGRENVYLNGAILGMSKAEITKKFDEIVSFSGIERFIDTPVKRYSSGMYVRLAFSVAAHLDSEILILDEVLAVGDSAFQSKCINKITEVTQDGRTVLFVSHSFSAIRSLCTSAILLEKGICTLQGSVENVITKYIDSGNIAVIGRSLNLLNVVRSSHAQQLIFDSLIFNDNPLPFGQEIAFTLKLKTIIESDFSDIDFGIAIRDKNSVTMIHCSNRFLNIHIDHTDDRVEYKFRVQNNLRPGNYKITLFLRSKDVIQDWLTDIAILEVLDGNPYNFPDTNQIQGSTLPLFHLNMLHPNEKLISKIS